MNDDELKLVLFGVGITLAFLGMRIFLDLEDKISKFDILHKK
jgi:hypothetical protein